jgi:hypothetical protein
MKPKKLLTRKRKTNKIQEGFVRKPFSFECANPETAGDCLKRPVPHLSQKAAPGTFTKLQARQTMCGCWFNVSPQWGQNAAPWRISFPHC